MNIRLRNTLFNNFFNNGFDHLYYYDNDDYDCKETEDGYEYQINLAGFKRESIKVNLENHQLKVKANQGDKVFSNVYSVPKKADSSASVAKYEDGMLFIKINKKLSEKAIELEVK